MTLSGSRGRILRNHLHHRFHQRRVLLRREKHVPHESQRSLNAGIEGVWLVGCGGGTRQDMAPELVWIEHAVVGFGGGAAARIRHPPDVFGRARQKCRYATDIDEGRIGGRTALSPPLPSAVVNRHRSGRVIDVFAGLRGFGLNHGDMHLFWFLVGGSRVCPAKTRGECRLWRSTETS